MTAVQDLLAALVVYLKAQSVVSDLVGARVFALELPKNETANMPTAAIVLSPSGGYAPGFTTTLSLDAARIDLFSYGATPYEAMRVRRAARAAMKAIGRTKVNTVLLHWALPAGGFADERDPQTAWPRVFESFSVMAAEQLAA